MIGSMDLVTDIKEASQEDLGPIIDSPKSVEKESGMHPDLKEFIDFISDEKNQELIDNASKSQPLEDVLYSIFTARVSDDKIPHGVEAREIKYRYSQQVSALKRWVGSLSGDSIREFEESGSLYLDVNGGINLNNPKNVGRLYFNLPIYPDNLHEGMFDVIKVFAETAVYCEKNGIKCQMKISKEGDPMDVSRADSMVFYFNSDDTDKVLDMAKHIYGSHKDAFNDDAPIFTKKIFGFSGISFGQESTIKGMSFGGVRSIVLANMYWEYKESVARGVDYDFQSGFRYWCTEYGIDPDEPAFILRKNRNQ